MSGWRRMSPPAFGRCAPAQTLPNRRCRNRRGQLFPPNRPNGANERYVIGLLQRVVEASVDIGAERVASIGAGLLVLLVVRPTDGEPSALRLLDRLLQYRVFADETGKINLSLTQTQGELLLVPQFTLAADTHKGLRPGFSTAAPPDQGRQLFDTLVQAARARHGRVETGVFGAHMRVSLTNDGPVTFWLES